MKHFKKEIAVKSIEEAASCTGDIFIMDIRGNVKTRIHFTGATTTSLQDCIGLYQLTVYQVSLTLGQGETTGGTVNFR